MRIIIILLLSSIFVGLSHAQYNTNLFYPEDVYSYELKNLNADLNKNYTFDQCAPMTEEGQKRDCNFFAMNESPDQAIRHYIYYLKTRQLKKAAMIANAKLGHLYQYPMRLSNTIAFNSYMIPFHEGLIGFDDYDQGGFHKLTYIVVKGGKLYKFRSNLMFIDGTTEGRLDTTRLTGTTNLLVYGSGVIKQGTIDIKIPYTYQKDSNNQGNLSIDEKWYKNYFIGKLQSKEMDEILGHFKAKIKKLF